MKQCFSFLCGLLCLFFTQKAMAEPIRPLDQMIQWELTDTSPFTDQAGYTPWQSFPGGKARFVSCSAGVPQNAVLLTGLQIIPQADVQVQKPILSTDFAAKETKILYPIQDPFATNTSAFYTGDVLFFPIVFHLNDTQREIQIPLKATLPLLTPNGARTETLSFTLPLKPDTTLSTPICAALMDTLQRVPEPAGQHVSGTLTQSGENTLDLNLSFDFTPTRVFAQLDGSTVLTPIQIRLKNKTAFLQFKTDTPLSPNTPLTFYIITDQGWFSLPLTGTTPPASTPYTNSYSPVHHILPYLVSAEPDDMEPYMQSSMTSISHCVSETKRTMPLPMTEPKIGSVSPYAHQAPPSGGPKSPPGTNSLGINIATQSNTAMTQISVIQTAVSFLSLTLMGLSIS